MPLNFDDQTFARRKPLWLALSDLFLDTELQDSDLSFIARTMKESGYSLDEITHILMIEVFPVCIPNLHSVAGIWEGFEESLVNEILKSKPLGRIQRWLNQKKFLSLKQDWEKIVGKFNSL